MEEVNLNEEVVPVVEEVKEAPSIEDMAAHDYQLLIPEFYKAIEKMSRNQLKRVFTALIEYPLANSILNFSYPEEKKAFYIGMQIFDCKFIIMDAVVKLSKDKEAVKQLQDDLEKMKETK